MIFERDPEYPATIEAPSVAPAPQPGLIGVGTWATQAEFKDIRATDAAGEALILETDLPGTKIVVDVYEQTYVRRAD